MSISGGVSDLFNAAGAFSASSAYGKAASIEKQNAAITQQSTAITEQQTVRDVYRAIGSEQADTAAAGFSMSGSALDLLKSSTQQGSLSKQLVENQGLITQNSFLAQASAYAGQASAAAIQGGGDVVSGVLGIFGL